MIFQHNPFLCNLTEAGGVYDNFNPAMSAETKMYLETWSAWGDLTRQFFPACFFFVPVFFLSYPPGKLTYPLKNWWLVQMKFPFKMVPLRRAVHFRGCMSVNRSVMFESRFISFFWNPFNQERLGSQREPCFNILWTHFGLCGGSYFRSKAILDAFSPEHVMRIDWKNLRDKEGAEFVEFVVLPFCMFH